MHSLLSKDMPSLNYAWIIERISWCYKKTKGLSQQALTLHGNVALDLGFTAKAKRDKPFGMLSYLNPFIFLFLILVFFHTPNSYALPAETKILRDISYGKHNDQKLDVYIPENANDAPVIFMVHGGAWRLGDKLNKSVVKNKVAHWVPKGFIFISINYRMLPDTRPIKQARDVETALFFSQQKAHEWGGSAEKFILMGHSAGAHLVSLVSSNYNNTHLKNMIKPWLGTVSLDSAAYDIVKIMQAKNTPRFYKKAFGQQMPYWKKASPIHSLSSKLAPFLAVCSLQRKDKSCSQAKGFIEKAKEFGTHTQLLTVNLSHRKINLELGKSNCYTQKVDAFLKTLNTDVESMLTKQSTQMQKNCTGI